MEDTKTQQIDPEVVRGYLREANKNIPQFRDIWYSYHEPTEENILPYWRLENEDGDVVLYNSEVYTLAECFEKFEKYIKEDPNVNYGKGKNN